MCVVSRSGATLEREPESAVATEALDTGLPVRRIAGRRGLQLVPVISVFLLFVIACTFYYRQILSVNSGHFVYALDDTYIHLALARNIAHGFYGVTPFEHTSPSSSVIWPFLLAGVDRVMGPREMTALWFQFPIVFAVLCACLLVLRRSGMQSLFWQTLTLLAIAALTPFLSLTFIAMEHLLHCLAMVLFCWWFGCALNKPEESFSDAATVAALAALLTASRYEGLFTLAMAGLMTLIARRWRLAVAVAVGGGLPVLAFGLYSVHIGGHLLPNSLLVKGHPLTWDLKQRLIDTIKPWRAGFAMIAGCVLLLVIGRGSRTGLRPTTRTMVLLVIATYVLHGLFASWGWYYRYEAYLVCCGLLVIALATRDLLESAPRATKMVAVTVCALCFMAAVQRAAVATAMIPAATHDIYSQQMQMARFFGRHYRHKPVALNDVGAVDYFAETNTVDVVGLTSNDVLSLGRDASVNDLQSLFAARHVEVIAVYPPWILPPGERQFPENWKFVENWVNNRSHVQSWNVIFFFGEGCSNARALSANLAQFDSTLPPGEIQIERALTICDQPSPALAIQQKP